MQKFKGIEQGRFNTSFASRRIMFVTPELKLHPMTNQFYTFLFLLLSCCCITACQSDDDGPQGPPSRLMGEVLAPNQPGYTNLQSTAGNMDVRFVYRYVDQEADQRGRYRQYFWLTEEPMVLGDVVQSDVPAYRFVLVSNRLNAEPDSATSPYPYFTVTTGGSISGTVATGAMQLTGIAPIIATGPIFNTSIDIEEMDDGAHRFILTNLADPTRDFAADVTLPITEITNITQPIRSVDPSVAASNTISVDGTFTPLNYCYLARYEVRTERDSYDLITIMPSPEELTIEEAGGTAFIREAPITIRIQVGPGEPLTERLVQQGRGDFYQFGSIGNLFYRENEVVDGQMTSVHSRDSRVGSTYFRVTDNQITVYFNYELREVEDQPDVTVAGSFIGEFIPLN